MKKRNVLLTALTTAFVLSASVFAVGGIKTATPSSVNAQSDQSYWTEFFDVESEGTVTFTADPIINNYSSISSPSGSGAGGLGVTFNKETKLTYKQPVLLSSLTAKNNLIEFYVNPIAKGVECTDYEFGQAIVRLENYDDPNEFVEIKLFQSKYDEKLGWAQASTNAMDSGGLKQGRLIKVEDNGTPIDACFTGLKNKAISTRFDSSTNTVLVFNPYYDEAEYGGVRGLVRCLSNGAHLSGTDNVFMGFNSDYVKLSVTFGNINGDGGNVILTNILDQKLDTIEDTGKPILAFPKDLDKDNLPVGQVGTFYPMWDVLGHDAIDGVITNEIDYKVDYLGVNGTDTPVSIDYTKRLGGFTPDKVGIYQVTFSLSDETGNTAEQLTCKFNVVPVVETINFALMGELPTEANIGEKIIIPGYSVNGGSGNLNVDFSVMDNDRNKVAVTNNQFVVDRTGNYSVSFKVSDYLGQERIFEYSIKALLSDAPIIDKVVIPSVIKADNYITLNLPKAYDYASYPGEKSEVPVTIEVAELIGTEKGEYVKVNANANGKYVYTPSTDAEKLYVRYKATSLIGNHEKITEDSEIKIISLGVEDEYGFLTDGELNKYFYNADNNIDYKYEEVINDSNSIEGYYYVKESGATLEFVNPLQANSFSIGLNFDQGKAYFKKISIKLTDSVNVNETLTFTMSPKDESNVNLFTVSTPTASTKGQMYDNTELTSRVYFKFKLTTQIVDIDGASISNIQTFDNGAEFKGFSSGRIYVKITFDEVDFSENKESRVRITQFYSQYSFSENEVDGFEPIIVTSSHIEPYNDFLSTVKIPAAEAYDVFSPNCDVYVSVTDPDNEYVLGSSSQGLIANKDYTFELNKHGEYFVMYTSFDESGNKRTLTFSVSTTDKIKPVIEIDGHIKTQVKVGDKLDLPEIYVSDNQDEVKDLYVYANLKTPSFGYKYIKVNDYVGTYVFQQAGTYELVVFAMDKSSNYTQKSFVITVTD